MRAWQRLWPVVCGRSGRGFAVSTGGIGTVDIILPEGRTDGSSSGRTLGHTADVVYLWLYWRYLETARRGRARDRRARRTAWRANALRQGRVGSRNSLCGHSIGMAEILPLGSLIGRLVALTLKAAGRSENTSRHAVSGTCFAADCRDGVRSLPASSRRRAVSEDTCKGPIGRRHGPVRRAVISGRDVWGRGTSSIIRGARGLADDAVLSRGRGVYADPK